VETTIAEPYPQVKRPRTRQTASDPPNSGLIRLAPLSFLLSVEVLFPSWDRRLAASRPAASDVPVEFAGLDGQSLELDDKSVDAAL